MLHFRQEMRGENSDQRSPLAVSTASRLQDDTLRSLILMSFRLWARFQLGLYSAIEAIKMENILFHFLSV